MLHLLTIAALSFFISVLIGRFLYKSDLPDSLIDQPNARKVHTVPTPLVGGITILFSLLIIVIFFNIYTDNNVQLFIIFSLYFFFIGLFDDLFRWNYKRKLFLQIIGVIAFIITISQNLTVISFSTYSSNNLIINYIIVGIWILFIINAFNFFDGINCLAGSLSIVFFSSYLIYYSNLGNSNIISILVIIIFSTIGFLIYNRAPAKMFLGDAGSMFLGFTLASFPLLFVEHREEIDTTFFFIVVFILISDTIFVLITRMIKNKNPFYPDKTHLHHQLLNLKFRNRYVVLIIVLGSVIHSILAFNSDKMSLLFILLFLTFLNFLFIIFPRFLPYVVKKLNLWGFKHLYDNIINYFHTK